MTLALLAAILTSEWSRPSEVSILTGQATYYSPGVMETVAVNRRLIRSREGYQAWLRAEGVAGAVALNRAGDLGRRVWIFGPDEQWAEYLVIDCAGRKDYLARITAGQVVEVDWPTARRWGMAGPVPVVVSFEKPNLPQPAHVPN